MNSKTIQRFWTVCALLLAVLASNAWLESQGSSITLSSVLNIRDAEVCREADKTISCDWARIMALYGLKYVVPVAFLALLLELTFISRSRGALLNRYPRAFSVTLRRGDWLATAYQLGWQVLATWWPVYVIWHCVKKVLNTTVFFVPNPHAKQMGGCQAYIQPNQIVANDVNQHLFGCVQLSDFYRTPFRFGWIEGPSFYPGIEDWGWVLTATALSGMAFLTLRPLLRRGDATTRSQPNARRKPFKSLSTNKPSRCRR